MQNITGKLKQDQEALKKLLPAEDILEFAFTDGQGDEFVVLFTDPVCDKELLGQLVVRPLFHYDGEKTAEEIGKRLAFPEMRMEKSLDKLAEEILAGNPVLLWEGMDEGIIVGTKKIFIRAIAEPPTDVTIKGPREGFIEDVKVNTSLVRRRFKTGELKIEYLKVGRRSQTFVAVCYLEGTSVRKVVEEVKEKINKIDIDVIPDSSYLTHFLASRPKSLMKQVGTTEKPDIFCAKIAEGRVGILVDGSPIALTVPYLIVEDFQSSEDYFVPQYRATFTRLIRLFALIVAIYLPAFYVAAQLFKLQLLPVKLLLTISGSIRDLRSYWAKPPSARVSFQRPPSSLSRSAGSDCTPFPISLRKPRSYALPCSSLREASELTALFLRRALSYSTLLRRIRSAPRSLPLSPP